MEKVGFDDGFTSSFTSRGNVFGGRHCVGTTSGGQATLRLIGSSYHEIFIRAHAEPGDERCHGRVRVGIHAAGSVVGV